MTSNRIRIAMVLGLAAGVAGCTSSGGLKLGREDNWGEAYRQTLAAQIINPAPEYDMALAASSGAKAAQAIERYRTDKVKQPAKQSISDIGQRGRGSSGASASGN